MTWLPENYDKVLSNPILQSVLIVWGAVIIAKIMDLVFTRIFKRIVDKTETSLDDQILQLLHRPIFYSILFVGFSIAVKTAHLSEYLDFALLGLFKTITIIIWLFVSMKVLVISMEWASARAKIHFFSKKHFRFSIIWAKSGLGYLVFISYS